MLALRVALSWLPVLAIPLLSARPASAAPGDLDPTFGSGGKVRAAINAVFGSAALARQADGKLVVAGSSSDGANTDFTLLRYNADGSLDQMFGTGGRVTTPVGAFGDFAYAVAVQSDGKIVVAGSASNGTTDFAVVRYTADGSLDASFGSGGKVTTPVGASGGFAFALAVQADGKLAVAGHASNGANDDFVVVRFNADGSLDGTFGTGGKVITPVGSLEDSAKAIAVQSDGKLVVVGTTYNGTNDDLAVVRYTVSGALDTTFGSGGKVITSFDPGGRTIDRGAAVVVQPDGKIVAAGLAAFTDYFANGFGVVRYNADGSVDMTFGLSGKVITFFPSATYGATALVAQADGKLVAAGPTNNRANNYDFTLARYRPDGSLDSIFGTEGVATTAIAPGRDDFAYGLVAQADGKLVLAGVSTDYTTYEFALARYLTDSTGPLGQCEADLLACQADLDQCHMNDADGDGEADATDRCPGTSASAAVDDSGCSLDQFCAGHDATTRDGARACKKADWKNDEPFMRVRTEGDCTVDRGPLRDPSDDRCVPSGLP